MAEPLRASVPLACASLHVRVFILIYLVLAYQLVVAVLVMVLPSRVRA